MATTATDSPRRVLGDRDVNKLVASPGKRDLSTAHIKESLLKGSSSLSEKLEISTRSPAGNKKRSAGVLEDIRETVETVGRKRMAIEEPTSERKAEDKIEGENFEEEQMVDLDEEAGVRPPFENEVSRVLLGRKLME